MKLKDLIAKLQALNPEAEVVVKGRDDYYAPCSGVHGARVATGWICEPEFPLHRATPSDTLIVLSE